MSASLQSTDLLYGLAADVFGVDPTTLSDDSSPESIENWDSLNHLNLIMAIEEEFHVVLTGEDVLQMHDLGAIREMLGESTHVSSAGVTFVDCRAEHIAPLKRFIARSYGEDYVLGVNDAYFDWQYATSAPTAGTRFNLRLALVSEKIVGCLGYIPNEISVGGRTLNGAWLANWMVDPAMRHLGLGPLLVRDVADQFEIALALGASREARGILVRMGWTDFSALKRNVAVLDPVKVSLLTREGRLDWPIGPPPTTQPSEAVRLIDRFGKDVTRLWDQIWGSQQHCAGTRRTARFLNWRYADHPQFDYRLFEARTGGQLRGFCVYRVEPVQDLSVHVGRIVEFAAEEEFEGCLITAIVSDARSNGVAALDFYCADDRFSAVFARHGFLPGEHPAAAEIPLLFQPIDRRKTEITFLADLQNIPEAVGIENWYVSKADGDQDRPC